MRFRVLALAALPLFGPGAPAIAGNLITNGDFSNLSVTYNGTDTNFYYRGESAQLGVFGVGGENGTYTGNETGWSVYGEGSNPYALWYNNTTATTQTALARYDSVQNNSLTGNERFYAVPTANAPGGFLALDAQSGVNVGVNQAVNVVAGQTYKLTFNWAAAQLATGSGAYNLDLFYALAGNSAINTSTAAFVTTCANGTNCIPQGGVYGWLTQTAYFEATATGTEYLSFFALSTSGNPPMALLDGISLVDAPEPGSVALVLAGVAGLALAQRRRARQA